MVSEIAKQEELFGSPIRRFHSSLRNTCPLTLVPFTFTYALSENFNIELITVGLS